MMRMIAMMIMIAMMMVVMMMVLFHYFSCVPLSSSSLSLL